MKIAVSGKGGVGKTTISAMLAGALATAGRRVIAVDADPDANLAAALGVPQDEPVTPLTEMRELIAERTGTAEEYGGYFKLNPHVEDIPERFSRRIGDIYLLTLGGVAQGGAGCICPATAVLKALLTHLILGRDDALVMDMEAGIEHLGRATAQSMDGLLLVVDGGPWSVQTALRVRKLAADLGMTRLFAAANRVSDADAARIAESLDGIELIGQLAYDPELVAGAGQPRGEQFQPTNAFQRHLPEIQDLLRRLERGL